MMSLQSNKKLTKTHYYPFFRERILLDITGWAVTTFLPLPVGTDITGTHSYAQVHLLFVE